jgi:hypothetical protein
MNLHYDLTPPSDWDECGVLHKWEAFRYRRIHDFQQKMLGIIEQLMDTRRRGNILVRSSCSP